MATGESLGELYARIGLNFDDLEHNFLQVDATLKDNMARLNRQRNIINLQTRIDLIGLDEATDATKIFEIRQRSLQQQIEVQQDRLKVYSDILDEARERTGDLSDETQKAQVQYEQARLAMRRLENQLENLNQTQNQTSSSLGSWKDKLDAIIYSGRVIGALENIKGVLMAINEESMRVINRFRELQTQSYKFNLPFNQLKDFALQIKLAGGELDDIDGYLKGITDALVKGESDDPEWIALSKYGETVFDANGRLKSYVEIWEAVARAYEKAKAAGEGIEFLQLTGGESGVNDAIQALERWNEAKKDAEKIIKAKIDATELHEADRAVNLLTEQFEEFRDEIGNIFTPATQAAAEQFFEVFRKATAWIKDNDEALKSVVTATLEDFFTAGPIYAPIAMLYNLITKTKKPAEDVKKAMEGLNKALEDSPIDQNPLSQYGIQRVNAFRDELDALRLELDYEDEFERRIAEADLWRQNELTDKLYVSTDEREAIEELYAAKIEKIHRDQADALAKIEEEQAEKERQILQDSKERTESLMQETADIQYSLTHSAYEKEIYDIENWKQRTLEALDEYKDAIGDKNAFVEEAAAITANALAKEAEAFEREMDRIRGKTQSLEEKIFEQEHSRRDIDIMRAQKERAEYYAEGIYDPKRIERWFRNRLGEIYHNVLEDTSGRYTQRPHTRVPRGYEVMYGDVQGTGSLARLPNKDFYGNIQSQVDKAMERFNKPEQAMNQAMATLQTGFDQSAQNLVKATDNLSNTFDNFSFGDMSSVSNSLSNATQRLADATQRVGEIAQNANRQPQQNINISPNINVNIDLGGAYVFDDNMKSQLTDDITKEVANAVTDAVSKATSQVDYGYGN